jgi:hypothetical protein
MSKTPRRNADVAGDKGAGRYAHPRAASCNGHPTVTWDVGQVYGRRSRGGKWLSTGSAGVRSAGSPAADGCLTPRWRRPYTVWVCLRPTGGRPLCLMRAYRDQYTSARRIFPTHREMTADEAHVPAEQSPSQAQARVPSPYAYSRGAGHHPSSPGQGPCPAECLSGRRGSCSGAPAVVRWRLGRPTSRRPVTCDPWPRAARDCAARETSGRCSPPGPWRTGGRWSCTHLSGTTTGRPAGPP